MGAQWKHKGRTENAAAKGKVFGKLVKEIMVAAKNGAELESNSRLRIAVEQAKKASMPKDTLERAIKKGAGLLDEKVHYEVVTYEGFAPHQVPVVVECLTDNKTRTAANVRMVFRKGQLAATGAITWDFSRLGIIEATGPAGADPEVHVRTRPGGGHDGQEVVGERVVHRHSRRGVLERGDILGGQHRRERVRASGRLRRGDDALLVVDIGVPHVSADHESVEL